MTHFKTLILLTATTVTLSACGATDRIANIGKAPEMTKISNPMTQPDYQPVSLPMPTPKNVARQHNSLWASDRVTFFKDQRAKDIGDIITVTINIADEASLENETSRSRSSNEDANLNRLLGLEQDIDAVLPEAVNDATTGLLDPSLSDFGSTSNSSGEGTTEREEEIDVTLAAIVTQILPNGNMVISGRQEVRVNFEKRILQLDGVIRPEDISGTNSIAYDRIAEARIAYGGEGHITDMQQPRYGQQLYDIIFPF
jgi:flagellar L-ring protein precursor FlgH